MVSAGNVRQRALSGRVNFTWNLAGKVAYAGSRAFLLVLIAKLGTPEMVGQYSLAFAMTAPVFMLADLDLRSVLATDTKGQYEFGHYLGLRLLTTLAAFAAVAALAFLRRDSVTGLVLMLVGLAKGFEAAGDILYGLFQRQERLDRLGVSLMLKGILSVLFTGLLIWRFHSLVMGAAGLAAAFMLVLFFYDLPAARPFARVRPAFSPGVSAHLARLCLPLGLVLLFVSLNKNMPQYFIEAFRGSDTLGYFAAAAYIVTTGSLAVSALGQSHNARLAKLFCGGDIRGFARLLRGMLLLTAVMGLCMLCGAALFGGHILALLYSPEYAAHSGMFTLIVGAGGIAYAGETVQYALTATRKFYVQPLAYGGVLLASLAANALLVPSYGLWGAAWGLVATSCLQLFVNLLLLARILNNEKRAYAAQNKAHPPASAVKGLRVERADFPAPGGTTFVREWKALLTACGSQTAFADPDWMAAYLCEYGRDVEPLVLAVYDGEELVAVFPLALFKRRLYRQCRFLGHPYATHMDIAVKPGQERAAAAAVWGVLERLTGPVIFDFAGLAEDSPAFCELLRLVRSRRRPRLYASVMSPVLRIGERTFDSFYKERFSSHGIKDARRNEKRLADLGEVSFREMRPDELSEAFLLHESRWRKKLDTSGFLSERSRRLFARLMTAGQDRWRAFALGLYLDGRLIAFEYGFVCGGRAALYRSAHQNLLSIYAPGKTVRREYIKRCFNGGLHTVDFGAGYEEYKLKWTDEREMVAGLSFPKGDAFSLALFMPYHLKGALRNLLKRSRRVVLFKRNRLGRIKYALSREALCDVSAHLGGGIAVHGAARFALGAVGLRKRLTLWLSSPSPVRGESGDVRAATLSDIPPLARLFGCPKEEIVRRFYRRQMGVLAERNGIVVCAAFVRDEKDRAAADVVARRDCREGDAAAVISRAVGQAVLRGGGGVSLSLFYDDRIALCAARSLGFTTAGKNEGGAALRQEKNAQEALRALFNKQPT